MYVFFGEVLKVIGIIFLFFNIFEIFNSLLNVWGIFRLYFLNIFLLIKRYLIIVLSGIL